MTEDYIEAIRQALYPFGFLSAVPYSLRFLIQWVKSELAGKTVVPKIFWQLTLLGNILLTIHVYIQLYFPLYFLLMLQTVMAWRNLDLMEQRRGSFRGTVYALIVVGILSIVLFWAQALVLPENSFYWIRSPQIDSSLVPTWLHVVGCIGVVAFSARFWIQWLDAERARESVLSVPFWWTSLLGAIVSGGYFVLLFDWVNAIGPLCAIVPYARNLVLYEKNR